MDVLARLLGRRGPEAQRRLERAVADVDRELAGNLELTAMFEQTRHAVVLETSEFMRHRVTIERELPDAYAALAELYERIPAAESAMERRGPANSLRDDDRLLVEGWEGDARTAQSSLRSALASPPPAALSRLLVRLRRALPYGR